MKKTIIVAVVLGAVVLASLNFHFILMDGSIKILKKAEPAFADTWIDARGAKKYKLLLKPSLVKAGVKRLIDDARKAAD